VLTGRHGDPALGAKVEDEIFRVPGGVLDRMRDAVSASDHGVAETALAWLLAQPGVTSVIVGATAPSQATRNARMPAVPDALKTAFTETSEALKMLQGPIIDQYAKESRIH